MNITYRWIRFYKSGDWQPVKFWVDDRKTEWFKALDWALPHKLKDWTGQFEEGDTIISPNPR